MGASCSPTPAPHPPGSSDVGEIVDGASDSSDVGRTATSQEIVVGALSSIFAIVVFVMFFRRICGGSKPNPAAQTPQVQSPAPQVQVQVAPAHVHQMDPAQMAQPMQVAQPVQMAQPVQIRLAQPVQMAQPTVAMALAKPPQ